MKEKVVEYGLKIVVTSGFLFLGKQLLSNHNPVDTIITVPIFLVFLPIVFILSFPNIELEKENTKKETVKL